MYNTFNTITLKRKCSWISSLRVLLSLTRYGYGYH